MRAAHFAEWAADPAVRHVRRAHIAEQRLSHIRSQQQVAVTGRWDNRGPLNAIERKPSRKIFNE